MSASNVPPAGSGDPGAVPTNELDRHFDDLIESLVGFYRSWFLALGVELGLVRAVAAAGGAGITAEELARVAQIHPPAADLWLRGAYAHRIVDLVASDRAPRFAVDPALAQILLDETSPYYLGGQFVRSIDSTLDYADLGEFFRTAESSPLPVVRADARPVLHSGWSKAQLEALGAGGVGGRLEPVLVTLQSGGSSGSRAFASGREEFALVLDGAVALTLDDSEQVLAVGDAVTIRPGALRRWRNPNEQPVRILIVAGR